MASPIPRVAPVTRATRPRRRPDFAVRLEVDAVKKVEGDVELSYLTDRTPTWGSTSLRFLEDVRF